MYFILIRALVAGDGPSSFFKPFIHEAIFVFVFVFVFSFSLFFFFFFSFFIKKCFKKRRRITTPRVELVYMAANLANKVKSCIMSLTRPLTFDIDMHGSLG